MAVWGWGRCEWGWSWGYRWCGNNKRSAQSTIADIRKEGFVRVRVDGEVFGLEEVPELGRYKRHNVEVVVDRLVLEPDIRSRLHDSLEIALKLGSVRAQQARAQCHQDGRVHLHA